MTSFERDNHVLSVSSFSRAISAAMALNVEIQTRTNPVISAATLGRWEARTGADVGDLSEGRTSGWLRTRDQANWAEDARCYRERGVHPRLSVVEYTEYLAARKGLSVVELGKLMLAQRRESSKARLAYAMGF